MSLSVIESDGALPLNEKSQINSTIVTKLIAAHPAFANKQLVGCAGFSLPSFIDPQICEINDQNSAKLGEMGISFSGKPSEASFVIFDRGAPPVKLSLVLGGRGKNLLVLESGSRLSGRVTFEGRGHIAVFGKNIPNMPCNITAVFRSVGCGLWVGRAGVSNNISCWIDGPGESIHIGDDYLFSWNIWLRCADGHAIVDLENKKVINHPKSIVLERHVWLGQDCKIFPGSTVGEGSIIGANSVVTSNIPPCSVAVGAPARVVKKNVSWTRAQYPSEEELQDLVKSNLMAPVDTLE